jgi:hypothetical protein
VEFWGAEFAGANFVRADSNPGSGIGATWRALAYDWALSQVDFRGALADGSARWPLGFDWRAAGVRTA